MRFLPDDIKQALDAASSVGWHNYLLLCRRYNLEPIEYLDYMEENFKYRLDNNIFDFKINNESLNYMEFPIFNGLKRGIRDSNNYGVYLDSLSIFSGVSLPRVSSIYIQMLREKSFSLVGLNRIFLPKLKYMSLQGNLTDLDVLEIFSSNTLKHLVMQQLDGYTPDLNLPSLKKLSIECSGNLSLSFLNNSNLPNLRTISIEISPLIKSKRAAINLLMRLLKKSSQDPKIKSLLKFLNLEQFIGMDVKFLISEVCTLEEKLTEESEKLITIDLTSIDWNKYPLLTDIRISRIDGYQKLSLKVLIDNSLPTTLERLKLHNVGLVCRKKITLPNLNSLAISKKNVKVLKKLILPLILTIDLHGNCALNSVDRLLAKCHEYLGNNRLTVHRSNRIVARQKLKFFIPINEDKLEEEEEDEEEDFDYEEEENAEAGLERLMLNRGGILDPIPFRPNLQTEHQRLQAEHQRLQTEYQNWIREGEGEEIVTNEDYVDLDE